MKDYMELGATPYGEDCAQLGTDNYREQSHKETRAYIRQLWRFLAKDLGVTPDNAPESFNIVVRSNPHDFGTYFEVAARFDDNDGRAMDIAYYLEEHSPEFWDEEAKKELGK